MNTILRSASLATTLLLLSGLAPTAHADTIKRVKFPRGEYDCTLSVTNTNSYRVNTITETDTIPSAVSISAESERGILALETVTIDAPSSGTILTSGLLDMVVGEKGGTATFEIVPMDDNGKAMEEAITVELGLDTTGGEVEIEMALGDGFVVGMLDEIKEDSGIYTLTLAVDFELSGELDGFSHFDATLTDIAGDLTAIDKLATLEVDAANLKWKGTGTCTAEKASEDVAALIRHQLTVSVLNDDGKATHTASMLGTMIDPHATELPTGTVGVKVVEKARKSGLRRSVNKTDFMAENDEIWGRVTVTDSNGTTLVKGERAEVTPIAQIWVAGLEFSEDPAKSDEELEVRVTYYDADGEAITEGQSMVLDLSEDGTVRFDGERDPAISMRKILKTPLTDLDLSVRHGISFDIRGSELDEVDSVVMEVITESDLYIGDTQLEMHHGVTMVRSKTTIDTDSTDTSDTYTLDMSVEDADGTTLDSSTMASTAGSGHGTTYTVLLHELRGLALEVILE